VVMVLMASLVSSRGGYKKTPGQQGFGVVASCVRSYRVSHAPIHHPSCMAVGRQGQAQVSTSEVIVAGLWHG